MKRRILLLSCFLLIIALLISLVVLLQDEKIKVKNEFDRSLLKSLIIIGKPKSTNEKIVKTLFEKTKYEIISIEEGICDIKLTYPDAEKLLLEIMDKEDFNSNNVINDEKSKNLILEELLLYVQNEEVEWKTKTVKANVIEGKLEVNEEILDAFYGGLTSSYNELISKYMVEMISKEQ